MIEMNFLTTVSNIPDEWRGAISRLKTLPDNAWLKDCRTNEQTEHWHDCKMLCSFLQKLLKDYFSGRESVLPGMSKGDRDFWIMQRDRWIKLYGAIQLGWSHIRSAAQRDDISIPDQPGAMLIVLLEQWASGLFAPCVVGFHPKMGHFSPRKAHLDYLNRYKLQLQRPLEKLKPHERQVWHFSAYENYCQIVLAKAAKGDRLLKQKLKEFSRVEAELETQLMAMAHPRKKLKGHQWLNGHQSPAV